MNTRRTVVVIVFAILVCLPSLGGAARVRDGSSFERAILVEGDYKHSVDWEWNYLRKYFRGRGLPREHALTRHNGRTYDKFVFTDGKVVIFDVTRFAREIFKKRDIDLPKLMREMGIEPEKPK
jgi:hypothetical protein